MFFLPFLRLCVLPMLVRVFLCLCISAGFLGAMAAYWAAWRLTQLLPPQLLPSLPLSPPPHPHPNTHKHARTHLPGRDAPLTHFCLPDPHTPLLGALAAPLTLDPPPPVDALAAEAPSLRSSRGSSPR